MTENQQIIRIAAKGDGVTSDGTHIAFSAPGDLVGPDGTLRPGEHHVVPPCQHFGKCGGCELQHVGEDALAQFVRDRVVFAAQSQGLEPTLVQSPQMSPSHSRRRVKLLAVNGGGRPVIGFRQRGSHKLVDLRECHVMLPELFALVEPFRQYFKRVTGRTSVEIEMTLVDQGVAVTLSGFAPDGLRQTEELLEFCKAHQIARMTVDHGYGPEAFWEPEPVTVKLGPVPVSYPPGAFLQATARGESALVKAAGDWLCDAREIVDLFSGLGTFAFALAAERKVLAVEADKAALLACKSAAATARMLVEAMHRDLFRNPLRAEELRAFDAILLDPPRAGARTQIAQIAASGVERVVYLSCNPSSWSRDGAVLAAAGYALEELRPVGQFRWSTHVEAGEPVREAQLIFDLAAIRRLQGLRKRGLRQAGY